MVPKSADFNAEVLTLLFCSTWFLWILYLIYYVLKAPVCPICGDTSFSVVQLEVIAPISQPVPQKIL